MDFWVGTANQARNATAFGDGTGGALSPAAGYANANLVDDSVASDWRASVASATHKIALTRPAGGLEVDLSTIHDCRASDGTAPVTVELFSAAAAITGPWTSRGLYTMNSRGDGSLVVAAGGTDLHWRVIIDFAAAKTLVLGEIGLWRKTALSRGPVSFAPQLSQFVRVTGGEEGSDEQVTKFAEGRHRIGLTWGRCKSAVHDELMAIHLALGGGYRRCVLLPDSSRLQDVWHGRMGSALGWSQSSPVFSGHSFEFLESARRLRG